MHIIWKQKFHCCIHNSLPLFPILSHINPVHTPILFLEDPFNSTLQSMPRSPKSHPSLRFPHQNPACTLPHACHMPHTSHFSWFDHPNNTWWVAHIMKLLLCSLLHSPVTSSYLGLSAPYSPTPSAYVPPSMWEIKFHTHQNRRSYSSVYISVYSSVKIRADILNVCDYLPFFQEYLEVDISGHDYSRLTSLPTFHFSSCDLSDDFTALFTCYIINPLVLKVFCLSSEHW
jgi:hypothetical protein